MENLTNEVKDEVVTTEEVTEMEATEAEEQGGLDAGTVLTGVCALTGVLTIAYGAVKVGKWAYKKVKTIKDSKVEVLNADEAEKMEATEVESTVVDAEK